MLEDSGGGSCALVTETWGLDPGIFKALIGGGLLVDPTDDTDDRSFDLWRCEEEKFKSGFIHSVKKCEFL